MNNNIITNYKMGRRSIECISVKGNKKNTLLLYPSDPTDYPELQEYNHNVTMGSSIFWINLHSKPTKSIPHNVTISLMANYNKNLFATQTFYRSVPAKTDTVITMMAMTEPGLLEGSGPYVYISSDLDLTDVWGNISTICFKPESLTTLNVY